MASSCMHMGGLLAVVSSRALALSQRGSVQSERSSEFTGSRRLSGEYI